MNGKRNKTEKKKGKIPPVLLSKIPLFLIPPELQLTINYPLDFIGKTEECMNKELTRNEQESSVTVRVRKE